MSTLALLRGRGRGRGGSTFSRRSQRCFELVHQSNGIDTEEQMHIASNFVLLAFARLQFVPLVVGGGTDLIQYGAHRLQVTQVAVHTHRETLAGGHRVLGLGLVLVLGLGVIRVARLRWRTLGVLAVLSLVLGGPLVLAPVVPFAVFTLAGSAVFPLIGSTVFALGLATLVAVAAAMLVLLGGETGTSPMMLALLGDATRRHLAVYAAAAGGGGGGQYPLVW
mmetsp:Transcript_33912/g.85095  ORF Transcript_33912/g.85095 Transcript_33912/m.85095 type:complete len:222 (+) Transcript_33912:2368-3033(+)